MRKVFVAGSINMDMVVGVKRFAKMGETVKGQDFFINCGGKGANQAAAAAKLGGDAVMVGCVGDDVFATQVLGTLSKYGVCCEHILKTQGSTGVAVIVVENGDNRIVVHGGANDKLELCGIRDCLDKCAAKGDILLCQNEIPLKVTEQALAYAKSIGMTTLFNPAPAAEIHEQTYSVIDYILPNETELSALTGSEDLLLGMQALYAKGVKNIVVTLGAEGSALYNNQGLFRVPAVKVTAIDTTAAGDTFIGAVAVKLSQGESINAAMQFATKCAALTVQRKGAMQSIPYLNEVKG